MTDRRGFMIGCGSALTAAGMPALAFAAKADSGAGDVGRGHGFDRAGFDALVNTKFRVFDGRRALFEATLTQVQAGKPRVTHEEFVVLFSAGAGPEVAAGIYSFRNAQTGRFDLYIEPLRSAGLPLSYKASFGLLT